MQYISLTFVSSIRSSLVVFLQYNFDNYVSKVTIRVWSPPSKHVDRRKVNNLARLANLRLHEIKFRSP